MIRLNFNSDDKQQSQTSIQLPASKSISNRLSIIQALSQNELNIQNWSDAEDSRLMREILSSNSSEVDARMAGTVIRFLTAYFALQDGKEVVLKGAERMHQRPIAPLVEALKELGADIEYLKKDGFPPLKIKGAKLKGKKLSIDASMSSQFVTALLLIAPYLENGIQLELFNPSSIPYIDMTLSLMKMCGISCERDKNAIKVEEGSYQLSTPYTIEPDWSSAAFFYQFFALSDMEELKIEGLQPNSLQGDRKCAELFEMLGVKTDFTEAGVELRRTNLANKEIELDLSGQPDLILPFVFAGIFLLPSLRIKGIQTLRIKESDRVEALLSELQKLAKIEYDLSEDEIYLKLIDKNPDSELRMLSSHNDHRIAMSIAPLTLLFPSLELDDEQVVDKSFPDFWRQIEKLEVHLSKA